MGVLGAAQHSEPPALMGSRMDASFQDSKIVEEFCWLSVIVQIKIRPCPGEKHHPFVTALGIHDLPSATSPGCLLI